MTLPLSDITVLDLSWTLPGPYCTQLLGDMGARVIKIERPDGGDYLRTLMPATFNAVNRGKRSVIVDIKQPHGKEVLRQLLAGSDILIEGFRPSVLARLGLATEVLQADYPTLVICSISGWGKGNLLSERYGHDLNYRGLAGAIGENEVRSGGASELLVADFSAGLTAATAILAALHRRNVTGMGAVIDLAIADIMLQWSAIQNWGTPTSRSRLRSSSPGHGIFTTQDQKMLTLGLIEDSIWDRMVFAADDARLRAQKYATHEQRILHSRELTQDLADLIGTRTAGEWVALGFDFDLPIFPVLTVAEALNHPHAYERGAVEEDVGVLKFAFPAKFDDLWFSAGSKVPTLNEHGLLAARDQDS